MNIDWLHVVLGIVSFVATIVVPIIAKRNVFLASVIRVIAQGIQEADHGPTKGAIASASKAAGVAGHPDLDAIVQCRTKDGGQ